MREIKFRAWDEKSQEMLSGDELEENGRYNIGISYGKPFVARIHPEWHECGLMQYTGLKDKNGVEIYEWDILYWDGSIIGVVSFECCEFIVGEGVSARAMCAMPADLDIKVIGNIHENPELLGDNND